MFSETVFLEGHIVDSLVLSKVLDLILLNGGLYEITRFTMGSTRTDTSRAEISVNAESHEQLEKILHLIGQHGATRPSEDAHLIACEKDGVFPEGFYSTTNLETKVRVNGNWIIVEETEMDCAIVLTIGDSSIRACCKPLHKVKVGDQIVIGDRESFGDRAIFVRLPFRGQTRIKPVMA